MSDDACNTDMKLYIIIQIKIRKTIRVLTKPVRILAGTIRVLARTILDSHSLVDQTVKKLFNTNDI